MSTNIFVEWDERIQRLTLTQQQLEVIWAKLPRFDLAKAMQGEHYISRLDVRSGRHYNDVRRLESPNACTVVWVGEWLVYMDSEIDEMCANLRMYDERAFMGVTQ